MTLSHGHGCSVSTLDVIILESFYLMVGSFWFMRAKSDWQYTSMYDVLYQRNLKNIAKK